jgi:hypothetical protein
VKYKGLLLSVLMAALAFPATALAGTPPSITSSFTPSSIPKGGTSTLSFTIANTDSGTSLTGVSFSDSLPGGLTVARPSDVSGNCGGTFTATAGSSTIGLSGGTLAAQGTTGDTCTVSAKVTSATPGVAQNDTGPVSSTEDGSSAAGDVESLTVVAPPKISSSFTPGTVGTGATTALSFTISNPGSAKTLNGVGFTDTLPNGLVVDNPNGQSGTCGSAGVLTATPGSSTISLTGGKLAPGASCTVSADVTSNTIGSYQNSTGPVTSTEGGTGNSDTESLTVVAAPTVTVSGPKDGSTFALGQKVIATYRCQEAPGGPGLSSCEGDVASGHRIDTSTPGAQTFSVIAISGDGQVTEQDISYTVVRTVSHLKDDASGVRFDFKAAGAGKLTALERSGHSQLGTLTTAISHSGTHQIVIASTAAGRKWLSKHKHAAVTLAVTFAPSHGKVQRAVIDVRP